MRKPSFRNCRLYVILDRAALGGRDPVSVASQAIRGGADAIQWRDKEACDRDFLQVAHALRVLTRRRGSLFIVNDRVSIALLSKADGVHVGHEDLPVGAVRKLVGRSFLIGRSTHSLAEAQAAQKAGADYLGVGPVFSTPTKPDYPAVGLPLVLAVKRAIRIPWVAIGGIDLLQVPLVLSAGATRIAVVRAVSSAPSPFQAARALKRILSSR